MKLRPLVTVALLASACAAVAPPPAPLPQWGLTAAQREHAQAVEAANPGPMPPPGEHVLVLRPVVQFKTPGDWSKCLIYHYRNPPLPSMGLSLALAGGPDGKLRISNDIRNCPPGGPYENGTPIGQNQLQVRGVIYTFTPHGLIVDSHPASPPKP